MSVYSLEPTRLTRAKAAFTTRNVNFDAITNIIAGDVQPQVGDLVLARVDKIGKYKRLDLATGRKAHLFVGDEIIVVYGSSYVPGKFEAETDLSPCHLIAAGGLAGIAVTQHMSMNFPTKISPIGLLANSQGGRINISDFALLPTGYIGQRPVTVAVVGTSMNRCKTTTTAHLIKGLVNSGFKVGAAKITGTASGNDNWLMRDAGAVRVIDFTDVGFSSTYQTTSKQVEGILNTLIIHLAAEQVDVIVLEIADGLFQRETSALISSLNFRGTVDGVFFAADSTLAAIDGKELLQKYQIPVLAIVGGVTKSPLTTSETIKATGLPVLDLEMLCVKAADLIVSSDSGVLLDSRLM